LGGKPETSSSQHETWYLTIASKSYNYFDLEVYSQSISTAIKMIWDWGFLWKNIHINKARIGIDTTSAANKQGTGVSCT
jgi:hypothetical protein